MKKEFYRAYPKKMIGTNEDFYPNYDSDYVEAAVHYYKYKDGKEVFWVSIWGADDFGLEKHFPTLEEALACYNKLDYVYSIKDLKDEGFINA